jgi:enoyl-CoA hydratase/carnithine racemase
MLLALMRFPYPTIACINGHTYGGGCPFSLAHDYRIMNAHRGYWSLIPVNLGYHFHGLGSLPYAKLHPQIARKVLLEAHKYTGKEAVQDGLVDFIAQPEDLMQTALDLANKWKGKAEKNVYAKLRLEYLTLAETNFEKFIAKL